jgi:homoserine kinase
MGAARMRVVAPASTANLGPGFDVLGLALDLPFELVVGPADSTGSDGDPDGDPDGGSRGDSDGGSRGDPDGDPDGDSRGDSRGDPEVGRPLLRCEPTHPAAVAYRTAGGRANDDELWWRSPIPPGRGLGFSGAARVAGAMAGCLESGMHHAAARAGAFGIAAKLEHHPDNAAASAYGGFTVTAGGEVVRLTVPTDLRVVAWWPATEVSTTQARADLPTAVSLSDAVFNIGRTALLVAALASGDLRSLPIATEDRLHQRQRLEASPSSQAMFDRLEASRPVAVWLSGSGPTVAALVESGRAERVAEEASAAAAAGSGSSEAGLGGTTRILDVDVQGVRQKS